MSRGRSRRRAKEIPQKARDAVDARDKQQDRYTGQYLGAARDLHHRKLRSEGGKHELANLVTLSGDEALGTHGLMHAHPLLARRLGYLVPSWIAEPTWVPLLVMTAPSRRRWVRLHNNGFVIPMGENDVLATMRRLGVWGPEEDWVQGVFEEGEIRVGSR